MEYTVVTANSKQQIAETAPPGLPARRLDRNGRAHIDLRAVLALALPLMANSGVQLLLNLTDVWFVGRISTQALAAVAAVHWLALVVVMVLGGIGMAVQTLAAQAYGAGQPRLAARAVWLALWGALISVPLYLGAAVSGRWLLAPFGLDSGLVEQAHQFWVPRVAGGVLGTMTWALLGFFNGIGQPRVTLLVTMVMALANVLCNQWFIFGLGWGVAGSGLASTTAQGCGLLVALLVFLAPRYRSGFGSHQDWRPDWGQVASQWRLGLPMGALFAADLLGLSLFQLMQVRLGTVAGAATQIVMVLTAVAYLPGVGIALAGTTLVGQSIGAGDRQWAYLLGSRIIGLVAVYMGAVGVLLALCGPWLLPLFAAAGDDDAAQVVALGVPLLWLAAGYQFFDGLNLGSGFCLRGAGDAAVPALLVLLLSWGAFVPLAHMLSFAPGQGWLPTLPALGWGATGGWLALDVYVLLLGCALLWRWRSRAWQ